MPFLMRGLIQKKKWNRDAQEYNWLKIGEAPAERLRDFWAKGNELSLWYIDEIVSLEESEEDPRIQRLVTAIAATRDHLEDYEYVLVDVDRVAEKQLHLHVNAGTTGDELVNSWHRDIRHLSASRLADVLNIFWQHGVTGVLLEGQIVKLAHKAFENKELDADKCDEAFVKKVKLKTEPS